MVLTVNQDALVNFKMQLGAKTETVEVNADALQVDTTSSQLGSLVSEHTIDNLPLNGRNLVDLTLLQPGVGSTITYARGRQRRHRFCREREHGAVQQPDAGWSHHDQFLRHERFFH